MKMNLTKQNILFTIKELRTFVRVETGLFITGLALSGYLVFSKPQWTMFFVMLAAFFSSCAIYSYNHITDKEEDAVNNKRLNYFVSSKAGVCIIIMCLVLSFAFSLFLPLFSFLVYASTLFIGMLYSTFRFKRYSLKNLYAGFGFSSSFLMGAASGGASIYEILLYLPIPLISGFIGNLLGDLRGYHGDKRVGLKTLPVIFGMDKSKYILHACAWCLVLLTVFYYHIFISIVPFMIVLSLFLLIDNMKITRACLLLSFATMPLSIAVIKWM